MSIEAAATLLPQGESSGFLGDQVAYLKSFPTRPV